MQSSQFEIGLDEEDLNDISSEISHASSGFMRSFCCVLRALFIRMWRPFLQQLHLQNAERILFEVHPPPQGISATVVISYTGDPATFSWIVPVPETPTLDVVPVSTLLILDRHRNCPPNHPAAFVLANPGCGDCCIRTR
ncbi:MAG: hypothetical protein GY822_30015 [Deltaproteobacteria bacterium]|nr:hypothetical protein [Deltaproteobacteria bacterium]